MKEMADILIFFRQPPSRTTYNADSFPYIQYFQYPRWVAYYRFVCPKPKVIPSYYNIMTPLSTFAWGAVLVTFAATTMGFLVISLVYGRLTVMTNKWAW